MKWKVVFFVAVHKHFIFIEYCRFFFVCFENSDESDGLLEICLLFQMITQSKHVNYLCKTYRFTDKKNPTRCNNADACFIWISNRNVQLPNQIV